MTFQPPEHHQCLVCGKPNARVTAMGYGSGGQLVETVCPDCKSVGTITNQEPWRGSELPIEQLRSFFLLAMINILDEPMKLQNQYWQGNDTTRYFHPWWFVKTAFGWIEIGWRKRVISIDWRHTTVRKVVTEDDVTKSETMVHAYSPAKVVEYLAALRISAAKEKQAQGT